MPEINIRLRIILILILILSTIIGIRVIYIFSLKIDEYEILDIYNEASIKRGDILDRNGVLLAVSDELESVYANPKDIKSINNVSLKLSQILNIPQSIINNKLSQDVNFVWIKRQILPQQAKMIKDLKLQGINLKREYKRFYPNKELASHILGFCNIDSKGSEGIEKGMDKYLIPVITENRDQNQDKKGNNVVLTIDAKIQAFADQAIANGVRDEKAESGCLILLDGKTGEILCMSNNPSFDPNVYKKYNQEIFRNFSIFKQFEPGSIMKIFTISSLLNENLISKSDFFYCAGAYEKNGISVKCTGIHGSINYYGILKYSCNTGMLEASERISDSDFFYYLKSFGFGTRSSLELPGEQSGLLRDIKDWNFRSMLSIPIGQEISVNALQIVRAATTFVNDGIMLEPFIVKEVADDKNKIIISNSRKEIRRVIRSGISSNILEAMNTSTDTGGTVRGLNIEGLNFAAKSGTGQIFDPKKNKYLEKDFTSSLLLIFPYNNPRYILYVVFYKPRGQTIWGGIMGARLVNQFLYSLTGYMDLKSENTYIIKNKNIKVNREYKKISQLPIKMPDLTGLSSGDVIDVFSLTDIEIQITGRGVVYQQYPQVNEILDRNTKKIKIYLH